MSRILVAEDSTAVRLLLRRRLEMEGHDVIEARDGAEAIEAAVGEDSKGPDLILMDATMPHVGGAEALQEIKKRSPEIPVLVVTALSRLEGSPAWDLADGHLTKPIDFGELFARIDRLTGGLPQP